MLPPPPFEGAKQDTIGVRKDANASCHIIWFVLIHLMENEMPLIHHVVKQHYGFVQSKMIKA
jgi:hypothetical protein